MEYKSGTVCTLSGKKYQTDKELISPTSTYDQNSNPLAQKPLYQGQVSGIRLCNV